MFRLITENYGELLSSKKMIISLDKAFGCLEVDNSDPILVYPNPVGQGSVITIEGVRPGSPIFVYNHLGACVLNMIATNNKMKLTLNLSQGIYLIRTEDKTVKIMVVVK
jgi:hypothetical protein